jgi:protein-tyrosine kinase
MTIMEAALERAKKLREKTEATAGTVARTRRNETTTVAPPSRRDFPRVDPDEAVMRENRILAASGYAQSTVSDSYRILRTRLMHRIETHGWSSFAVTSAGAREGKSVTVLNLGISIAREKRRNVFLLDLDLRNPSLCRYLGVRPRAGVGQYLAGEAAVEDVLMSIGIENLALAGGQSRFENSTELLGGQRLGELLDHIMKGDPSALILADLPPLTLADALVVAPKLSATLLVVAEGITQRNALARALDVLGSVPLAGIALNHSSGAIERYYG